MIQYLIDPSRVEHLSKEVISRIILVSWWLKFKEPQKTKRKNIPEENPRTSAFIRG